MMQDTVEIVDTGAVRQAFGRFATGVTVVTTLGTDGIPYGAMVTAFVAVSMDPPLAQITLTRSSRAAKQLDGSAFAINVLSADQLEVARHFAGLPGGRPPVWELRGGVPVLQGNAATLECRAWNSYDGGDHNIVVGEVQSVALGTAEPLLFLDGRFCRVGEELRTKPAHQAGDTWFEGVKAFRPFGSQGR